MKHGLRGRFFLMYQMTRAKTFCVYIRFIVFPFHQKQEKKWRPTPETQPFYNIIFRAPCPSCPMRVPCALLIFVYMAQGICLNSSVIRSNDLRRRAIRDEVGGGGLVIFLVSTSREPVSKRDPRFKDRKKKKKSSSGESDLSHTRPPTVTKSQICAKGTVVWYLPR